MRQPLKDGDATPGVTVLRTDTTRDHAVVSRLLNAARPAGLPVVTARPPSKTTGRRSDFALDLLDTLGRVGCQRAARRVHEQDLIFLLPWLLTDDIAELLVCEAQWLCRDGLSDLKAVTDLAGIDLILHIGEAAPPALQRWLQAQTTDWPDFDHALHDVERRPAVTPACPWSPAELRHGRCACHTHASAVECLLANLRDHIAAGVDPAQAKDVLCDLITVSSAADRDRLRWAFGRDVTRAAVGVLHRQHGMSAKEIAHLSVDDVDRQGQVIGARQAGQAAAGALLRQRIYARLVARRALRPPLATVDGSPMELGQLDALIAGSG